MGKLSLESLKDLISDGEEAIRAGRGHSLKPSLENINSNQVPDQLRLPLANLCRRVGLVTLAIRILGQRITWQNLGTSADTTSGELAEYALLLQRIGSISDAHRLLDSVDTHEEPKALLYRAFCFFNTWDHKQAIPYLNDYVSLIDEPYQKLVGKLNLAAALCIAGEFERSLLVTDECLSEAKANESWRMYANALELKAQNCIHLDRDPQAASLISEASRILESNQTYDSLFVRKWEAFLKSKEAHTLEPLEDFKKEATQEFAWESAREADLYGQMIIHDAAKLEYLLFGTPFDSYKERVRTLLGIDSDAENYLYGSVNAPILDIATGTIGEEEVLPVGKKVHQFLDLLTRDFYRPARLGDIFSALYPGEHFDIDSSPDRVYQVVKRTRSLTENHQLPIQVVEFSGFYKLHLSGELAIQLKRDRPSVYGLQAYLNRLKDIIGQDQLFRATEVRESLNLKLSKTREVIDLGIQTAQIRKVGKSSATRYQLVQKIV